MINLTYNDLANGLHLALGALFVFIPVAMGCHNGRFWGSIAGFIYGIIKEFWVDLEFENESTSGGIKGGCIDFLGYLVGVIVANVILLI